MIDIETLVEQHYASRYNARFENDDYYEDEEIEEDEEDIEDDE